MGILQTLGLIYWQDPFNYHKKSNSISLGSLTITQQHWQKQMQQYLQTKQCRWKFLLLAFGFTNEATNFKCGNCDNCLRLRSNFE